MRRSPHVPTPSVIAEFMHADTTEILELRWKTVAMTMRVAKRRSSVMIELGKLDVTLPRANAKRLTRLITRALNPEEIA